MAVTLICIGIPVCRPAYRRLYRHYRPKQGSGYHKHSYPDDSQSFGLKTIGGTNYGDQKNKVMRSERDLGNSRNRDVESASEEGCDSLSNVKVGNLGPFTKTHVGHGGSHAGPDNASDEVILGNDYWRNQTHSPQAGAGIMVTETVRVDRS